ncbi:hypothetical protein GCM10020229_35900 [Kitasatospora albolonga]|uniref:alkaline phosphatase family protein n=1 Tax=Kitasatospora albolonga TaxID=68173 RepID=UPI00337F63B8
MTNIDRRRFLQLAGGTAALTMLSDSIARAAAIPAQGSTGTIQDVEHIVVLMQENRSFDHYFGAMKGVRGFGDPRPVTLPSGKSVWNQSSGGKVTLPFRPNSAKLGMEYLQASTTTGPVASRPSTRASTTTGSRPRPPPRWPT